MAEDPRRAHAARVARELPPLTAREAKRLARLVAELDQRRAEADGDGGEGGQADGGEDDDQAAAE